MVSQNAEDLQQKLMKVYVRMQDVHMETPPDVHEALVNPKRLAKCMHRANLAKFKTLDRDAKACAAPVATLSRLNHAELFISDIQ